MDSREPKYGILKPETEPCHESLSSYQPQASPRSRRAQFWVRKQTTRSLCALCGSATAKRTTAKKPAAKKTTAKKTTAKKPAAKKPKKDL